MGKGRGHGSEDKNGQALSGGRGWLGHLPGLSLWGSIAIGKHSNVESTVLILLSSAIGFSVTLGTPLNLSFLNRKLVSRVRKRNSSFNNEKPLWRYHLNLEQIHTTLCPKTRRNIRVYELCLRTKASLPLRFSRQAEAGYLCYRTRVADGFHPPDSLETTEGCGAVIFSLCEWVSL